MTESNGYRLFADGTHDFFGFWKNIKKTASIRIPSIFFREVNLT